MSPTFLFAQDNGSLYLLSGVIPQNGLCLGRQGPPQDVNGPVSFQGRSCSREILLWVLIPALSCINDLTFLDVVFILRIDCNIFHTKFLGEICKALGVNQ